MKRRVLGLAIVAAVAGGSTMADAEVARERDDCIEYCALKAVERCDDVTSTWCNAYIVGCLAGCGISHL
jgi:hypothetical protein